MGDNGLKSKTGGPLRGNAESASELIKALLCISKGAAACLMADSRRGNLAAFGREKERKNKKKRKKKEMKRNAGKHDCSLNL